MTVSLILSIVLCTAVFTGVLGLLLSSIATQHHSLPGAEIHTPARRAIKLEAFPPTNPPLRG
jgi:hypothetical protein